MSLRAAVPRRRRAWLLSLALLVALPLGTAAQQTPPAVRDTVPEDTTTVVDSLPVSPRGAFLRSLVLPGWGQAYVGAPGRGAVYFALESAGLWMVLKSRRELKAARDQQAWMRETGALGPDARTTLVTAREGQVEDWITFSAFLLLFSGADAYVAAQLSDFNEHLGVLPGPEGGMRLEATFPLGRRRR